MISFREAQEIVLRHARALPGELRRTEFASNCFLAEDIRAPFSVPQFDHSAVDGFALKSVDVAQASAGSPIALQVIGTVKTGSVANDQVGFGSAIRIFTGAMLPQGADAVMMVEDVSFDHGVIQVTAPIAVNKNIRRAGESYAKDEICLVKGTKLTPAAIGLAASLGYGKVQIIRKPRIAVIVTGNELVEPDTPLGEAQIYDANRFALTAALAGLGIDHVVARNCPDDRRALQLCLEQELHESDVVITSGGASVGDVDYVKPVLKKIGATIHFEEVSIKPGKPTVFATLADKVVFGLPGNPVSALVTFLLFVKPAVLRMCGSLFEDQATQTARLVGSLRKRTPRTEFVRAATSIKDDELVVTPSIGQESHMLGGLVAADVLIVFEGEPRVLAERSPVQVFPIRWS